MVRAPNSNVIKAHDYIVHFPYFRLIFSFLVVSWVRKVWMFSMFEVPDMQVWFFLFSAENENQRTNIELLMFKVVANSTYLSLKIHHKKYSCKIFSLTASQKPSNIQNKRACDCAATTARPRLSLRPRHENLSHLVHLDRGSPPSRWAGHTTKRRKMFHHQVSPP